MSLINDQKLITFYYNKWNQGSSEFCKENSLRDIPAFDKFLSGGFDHQVSRDALKKFWEKYQAKQMQRLDDQSDSGSDSAENSPSIRSTSSTSSSSLSRANSNINLSSQAGNTSSRGGDSSSGGGGGDKRVRNLLKTYYGASIGEGESQIVNDPMNIDGPSFNLSTYFENIVKTSTLPQLISKDNEMVSEIRQLDGDMKTLVYENYTKFINATDIIKKMKTNVENMEEGMERLSKNMDIITNCSEKINSTLSSRRDKIDQLSGLQKLLQKLQYLTALPSSLKNCLDMQLYNQAVKYYNSNSGILKQYSHIPSFHNIQLECDSIMNSMKQKLLEKLTSPESNSDKNSIIESSEILMELLESVETVRSKYLIGRKIYLTNILETFGNIKEPVADIIEFISELNRSFLSEHIFTNTSYKSLFINRLDGSDSVSEKKKSIQQLEQFSKEIFNKYLSIAKSKLSTFKNPKEKIQALEIIYSDVLKLNQQTSNNSNNVDLTLTTSINDIINSTVNDQISYYFENLSKIMKSQIMEMNQKLIEKNEDSLKDQYLQELSEQTLQLILGDITELFNNLKPFFISTTTQFLTPHYGTIFTKIQVKLQQFFLFLGNIHFLEYLDIITLTQNKEEFGSRFLLLLSNICLLLESKGIPQVVQMLNDFLQLVKGSMTPSQIQQNDLNSFQAFNQPDLSKRLRETSQKILSLYTKLSSLKLEKLLRRGLENNWKFKEPTDVRSVIELYLEELLKIQLEIQKIFNSSNNNNSNNSSSNNTPNLPIKNTLHSRTQSSGSGNNSGNNNNPTNNKSNAFDKKLDIYSYSIIEFNSRSILTTIVKLSLKSYIESLRTKTFAINGLHQLIIDNQFLKICLIDILANSNGPSNLSNNAQLENLLEICDQTINERCVDNANISPAAVKQICDSAMKKRKEAEVAKKLEQQQQ